MIEQPLSRTFFYILGSIWFCVSAGQKSWQNRIHYSILEEIQIMNKMKMDKMKKKELQ